ncbi:hypothetical protein LOZ38_006887, partial [Ophidiomyces ophidiicola]
MSYLSPLPLAAPAADYLAAMPPLDAAPPAYDHPDAFASDDLSFAPPALAHPLRRFSYDEPFPDLLSPFDGPPDQHAQHQHSQHSQHSQQQLSQHPAQPQAPQHHHHHHPPPPPPDASVDHNHKLLSFSLPAYNFTLLDYSFRRTSLSLAAQLHGMFFLAESPWTAASPTAAAAAA